MTIGEFATTQIWVPQGRLDEAREIMLEAEVEAAFPGPEAERDRPVEPWVVWLVAGTIVALVAVRAVANLF